MEIKLHAFNTLTLQGGGQLLTVASLLLGSFWYTLGILRASLDVAARLLGLTQAMVQDRLSYMAQKAADFLTS